MRLMSAAWYIGRIETGKGKSEFDGIARMPIQYLTRGSGFRTWRGMQDMEGNRLAAATVCKLSYLCAVSTVVTKPSYTLLVGIQISRAEMDTPRL